jgi:predicted kinase
MSQPTLYLFVGYPGAGKTTVARLLRQATGAVHIWADHERQLQFGQPNLDQAQISEFYDRLNSQTEQLLAEGKSVIFDTNFNYRKDRDCLREIATKHGAKTVVIWLNTPVEIARIRAVEKSHGENTRVWGNMTPADFERLSDRLEAPTPDENPVEINGAQIDEQQVIQQLNQQ